MSQDSREQFEQAYSEDNAVDPEPLFYSRQGDSYKVPKIARAWYWWKRARAGVAPDRGAVRDAVAAALGEAMDCTRVWSAWGVGTMSQDDFQLVAEDDERLDEIVDAAIEAAGAKVAT